MTSYRAKAEGEASTLIQAHGLYSALGRDAKRRQVSGAVPAELELVDQIRRATNGNFVLGDERFAREIEAVIGCRAVPGKSGRPRKRAEPASGTLLDG
jgi:putative transposase